MPEDRPQAFVVENLRLRELVAIVAANRGFFEAFETFLRDRGYRQIFDFAVDPDDARASQLIQDYLDSSPNATLYDGLAGPYSNRKAKWYFLAWLFRDAPAQRLGPLLERGGHVTRRQATPLNEIRKFVAPLFPDPASWTWPAVSEVILARLEGSRRALKGNLFEGIVRDALFELFVEFGFELTIPEREVRLHDETYDVQVIGPSRSVLIPVKTRETMGGGHAMLFTRDIHKSISVAQENGFECIPIVIAESWGGDLASLPCSYSICLPINPNHVEKTRPLLAIELRRLSSVFADLASS